MNRGNIQIILGCIFLLFSACEGEGPISNPDYVSPFDQWIIPVEDVFDAGVGKDGIPSLDDPKFSMPEEINPAFDDVLVLGIEHEGELKAYPFSMLNWHEIINDEINGKEIAITYCPLTGTGIGWDRRIDGFLTSYGVSGLLFNTNLMPYDRRTGSTWSQQRLECVNGPLRGRIPQTYTLIETTFKTWKKSFPNSKILNADTDFDIRYIEYPYGNYLEEEELFFFPVEPLDRRLPLKERVLGVMEENAQRAYRFNDVGQGMEVIQDTLDDKALLIVRSQLDNINAAFYPIAGRSYSALEDDFPRIVKDDAGNYYDLAGRIIEGPDVGQKLERPLSFIGYWFSWGAFYPAIEIY
ncbi:MAG: DUF3179 domain-containing protein [Bacteroidia bacterium]|nr:DUF3179 domain-containing protein [Bacteroidia bacterium]